MLTPSLTAALAPAHSSAIAFSRPGPSSVGSNSIGSVRVLKPPMAGGVGHAGWIDVALSSSPTQRSLATSSLLRTGYLTSIWRHDSGSRIEQVAFRADGRGHRRDQLLADRVERRVGDLREQLLEVVEQQPRLGREHRQRRCPCPSSRSLPRRPAPSARAAGGGLPRCSRRRAAGAARSCDRARGRCGASGRSRMSIRCSASQRWYGCAAASSLLISSSSTMRPRRCRRGRPCPGAAAPCSGCSRAGCRGRRPRSP